MIILEKLKFNFTGADEGRDKFNSKILKRTTGKSPVTDAFGPSSWLFGFELAVVLVRVSRSFSLM